MTDTLAEIINYKKQIVELRKRQISLSDLETRIKGSISAKGFHQSLRNAVAKGEVALIAELKKASPSKGLIRQDFQPLQLARAYQEGGATCLSVLTDEKYFQGSDIYLTDVISETTLPVLRKDFMVDSYQIIESRALGADCILLIMAALSDAQAQELETLAFSLGMDVLAETHNRNEVERALTCLKTPLIGINNRNLKTLEVDIATSMELRPLIADDKLVVCESGIGSYQEIRLMQEHNIHTFLVGESLMRHQDVAAATKLLLGKD